MATNIDLNHGWKFYKNKDALNRNQNGENVTLPHTWNALDGQDGGSDYYRSTCWYVRSLVKPEMKTGDKAYLEFDGAAMIANVYLNGQHICCHEGGYSAFRADITDSLLDGENTLLVSISNERGAVYPQSADFTFYGGIYRNVRLVTVPAVHFDRSYLGTNGLKVTPIVTDLETRTAKVTLDAWVQGGAESVKFSIISSDGITLTSVDTAVTDGHAQAELSLESVRLWDGLTDPYRYIAKAQLPNGETVTTRFGCRKIQIDPQQGFLLNGRSYPLRGVSRHQDWKDLGNALTIQEHEKDMELIRQIGANAVRLAHYQHAQEFYDLCDEFGIIVWAEIPYITMHMPGSRANTLRQMEELVVQNYNHPSIAVWGLSNEITVASPVDADLLENHRMLNDLCHRLDPNRATTMAHVYTLDMGSELLTIPDVNGYNLYFGWYTKELADNDSFFDTFHKTYPERCIGFSEYGADTNVAYHSTQPQKGDYTEEYQCIYHEHIIDMLRTRPWIWGSFVWNMFDFAADGRDEGGKHGENQKGLVTFDRQIKKDAFFAYKAAWSREPFIHICGRRYVNRAEEITEVKVYSNQPEVSLYVDGQFLQTICTERVFRFCVPISGIHTIEAISGKLSDSIRVCRVEHPDPAYRLVESKNVTNWFDNDVYNPDCYSIFDTVGEIEKCPQAYRVITQIMSHGGDADQFSAMTSNPAMKRMINRQTLQNLLKHAGVDIPEAAIRQLNGTLQKFRKV